MTEKVKSPCVSICALDAEDICVGCHRSAEEISSWSALSEDEKRQVLAQVAKREEKSFI
ncbi:DUF1289 domain-containing protein [Hahella ganghwensis]|uniref:DUF1289 domain-containing protein n=1 Tax=Hahella ganghwensis TaxID=286420 RepID=UPI0003656D51|nr:DUF1289 domain-containing protein [Hahella ganghwensis]